MSLSLCLESLGSWFDIVTFATSKIFEISLYIPYIYYVIIPTDNSKS